MAIPPFSLASHRTSENTLIQSKPLTMIVKPF
jgi:hypothetical protein